MKSTCSKRRWPRGARSRGRAGDDVGLGVVDLEHPGGGGHRLLGHRQDHAERGDRPDQREHQRDERDQLAGRQGAAADADRAEEQHDDDGEVGDHLEEGPEPRRQPDLVDAGVEQAAARPTSYCPETWGERPKDLITRMPTAPSSASVARSPCWSCTSARDDDVALLEAHREPHDRGGRRGDDQAERPVHVEQHERW